MLKSRIEVHTSSVDLHKPIARNYFHIGINGYGTIILISFAKNYIFRLKLFISSGHIDYNDKKNFYVEMISLENEIFLKFS